MKDPHHQDPIDLLGEVYEKMYESTADNLHKAEEKSGPALHKLIDEAKDEAVKLKKVSAEDGEKLAEWLKRDMDDTIHYLKDSGHELKDWLGFETTLLETGFLDLMLKAADKTTLELMELKERIEKASTYHTGEITGPGTLICDQCGEKLHFHKTGKIPPCPKCHATTFHRKSR